MPLIYLIQWIYFYAQMCILFEDVCLCVLSRLPALDSLIGLQNSLILGRELPVDFGLKVVAAAPPGSDLVSHGFDAVDAPAQALAHRPRWECIATPRYAGGIAFSAASRKTAPRCFRALTKRTRRISWSRAKVAASWTARLAVAMAKRTVRTDPGPTVN